MPTPTDDLFGPFEDLQSLQFQFDSTDLKYKDRTTYFLRYLKFGTPKVEYSRHIKGEILDVSPVPSFETVKDAYLLATKAVRSFRTVITQVIEGMDNYTGITVSIPPAQITFTLAFENLNENPELRKLVDLLQSTIPKQN